MNEPRQPLEDEPPLIEPVAYRPMAGSSTAPRRGLRFAALALVGAGLVTALVAWFLFTSQAIQIEINPSPDRQALSGGLDITFGERRLLRPGDYTLHAEKEGYRPLDVTMKIGPGSPTRFQFQMQLLPGLLSVRSQPAGELAVDGKTVGSTPLDKLELAPGSYKLALRAPRHKVYETELTIEGGGKQQSLEAILVPDWAPVSFSSKPAQATLLADGKVLGKTPLTVELGAGRHEIALQLDGHKTWKNTITVTTNTPLSVPQVTLAQADGGVRLESSPSGASVTVGGGDYRGETPLDLALSPEKAHRLRLSKAGYQTMEHSIKLAPNEHRKLAVSLQQIAGVIVVSMQPADATLYVDGQARTAASGRLELSATTHQIEVRKPGYATYTTTLTPRPGFEQRLNVTLRSLREEKAGSIPTLITTSGGQKLKLIQPGRFTMGSPRGTQGRQTNEGLRPVHLTRSYYLATTEVTNAQFRQFDPTHSSGIFARETLNNDAQPVVRIRWEQAARYCNWLSARDGLPPAYRENGGRLSLIEPATTGYRLPTEAEWAWAARFAGNAQPLRYPWGEHMPPTGRAGNYADRSAAALVVQHLKDYQDGYPASAPVASFAANGLGLHDLGGNVAEWVNDLYGPPLVIGAQEAVDPTGAATGTDHVIRGSSWMHGRITELRLAFRDFGNQPRPDLGFRIARYADSP